MLHTKEQKMYKSQFVTESIGTKVKVILIKNLSTEAATRGVLKEKVFLEILQSS